MQRTIQRSIETWRELVARQDQSGLSVQAFCRQERLNVWTFYGWRSRLRKSAAMAEHRDVVSEQNREPAGFIDLGALGGGSSRWEIRLDLGGGVVLQVVRG
jgi:putative transposase